MVTKKKIQRKNFFDILSTTWFRLTFIVTIVGAGFAGGIYMFNTFPTKDHVEGRFAPKSSLVEQTNMLNNKIKDVDSQATGTLKEFRNQYRVERLSDIMQQINLIEKQLLVNPNNKSLDEYKKVLEREAERLKDKINSGN